MKIDNFDIVLFNQLADSQYLIWQMKQIRKNASDILFFIIVTKGEDVRSNLDLFI